MISCLYLITTQSSFWIHPYSYMDCKQHHQHNSEKDMSFMHEVIIYTDGACSGNPGAGGWGAILMCGEYSKKISGSEEETTNNRMELTAVISALLALKSPSRVTLYSDSAYVVNAFNQDWITSWQNSAWRTSGRKPVQNKDLWLKLIGLTKIHKVKFIKVKGHSDNAFNNECDKLATEAIKNIKR